MVSGVPRLCADDAGGSATARTGGAGDSEKAAYLGVATAPAGETLAKHLNLGEGVGLVVEYIDPGSPAAGKLQVDDVLCKLNEQLLVNHEQLAVVVRTFKPGDEVTLSIIRQGKPAEAKVKLSEKELPRLQHRPWGAPRHDLGPSMFPSWTNIPGIPDWMKNGAFEENEEWGRGGPHLWMWNGQTQTPGPSPDGQPSKESRGKSAISSVVSTSEAGRTFTLSESEEGQRFTVADGKGKTLFQGQVGTEGQDKQVPAEFREKLKELVKLQDGLHLQVTPSAPGKEPF